MFFSDESILLDLKHLLIEAKQKVPPFLAEYVSESEKYLDMGGKAFNKFVSFIICPIVKTRKENVRLCIVTK